jgi:hypothetical protein
VDIKNNNSLHKKALKRTQDIFWISVKNKRRKNTNISKNFTEKNAKNVALVNKIGKHV